jgi:hypothetical protein
MVKTALALLCFGVGAGVLIKNNDYKHLFQRGMRDEKGAPQQLTANDRPHLRHG